MSPSITAALRSLVISRAADRCEYCGLAQEGQEAVFHVDHVVPRAANGPTHEANLALACVGCSLRKGARQTGLDPTSGADAPLFNPRVEAWADHFTVVDHLIVGLSPTGRATVEALAMNRPLMIAIREEQTLLGR